MLELKPDARLALAENIMLQAIPELDHYYAFDVANGDQYQLNHTAHWVLGAVGSGIHFAVLIQRFTEAFELEAEKAREDLEEAILYSLENDLVRELGR